MNIQEREQLTRFLQQLTEAQAARKDSEAASLIGEACLRQSDAAYLLVQRAMLLDQAVQESTLRIARLQEELAQARAAHDRGSFLDPNAWGNSVAARPGAAPQAALYPAAPAPAPAAANAPATPSAWGSGMLGNIATTAAGVVAGGFLFQGIGHLLGNQNAHAANAANPGSANSLASSTEAEAGTGTIEAEAGTGNAGVFDTSSVDDFIADDSDDIV